MFDSKHWNLFYSLAKEQRALDTDSSRNACATLTTVYILRVVLYLSFVPFQACFTLLRMTEVQFVVQFEYPDILWEMSFTRVTFRHAYAHFLSMFLKEVLICCSRNIQCWKHWCFLSGIFDEQKYKPFVTLPMSLLLLLINLKHPCWTEVFISC